MKLVSRFEAAPRSTAELHSLLGEAKRAFNRAACGSQERHDALESIRKRPVYAAATLGVVSAGRQFQGSSSSSALIL